MIDNTIFILLTLFVTGFSLNKILMTNQLKLIDNYNKSRTGTYFPTIKKYVQRSQLFYVWSSKPVHLLRQQYYISDYITFLRYVKIDNFILTI